jgi:hypothetical protein
MMCPMHVGRRKLLGVVIGATAMDALAWPSFWTSLVVRRECYRLAEFVGIMDPSGSLGGQVAGYNFQRSPAWVHPASEFIAAVIGFAPALALALLLMHRIGFGPLGWRATLCGRCGAKLRGLTEPRCAACGAEF